MVFDHTGVRVTSTPDCVLICGFVKTVTFGFWSPPSHLKANPAVWSQLLCVSRVIFWSSSSCSLPLLLVIFSVLKVWRQETTGAVECMNTVGPHSKPDSRQTPAVARHSYHHVENSWVGKNVIINHCTLSNTYYIYSYPQMRPYLHSPCFQNLHIHLHLFWRQV